LLTNTGLLGLLKLSGSPVRAPTVPTIAESGRIVLTASAQFG
jgi:hypothetical protein